jgi:hypothetical protein
MMAANAIGETLEGESTTMPLSNELALRYRELFRNYGTGLQFGPLIQLKGRLAGEEEYLREDALFFLLLNLDQMIGRAFSGYIPDPNAATLGAPMASADGADRVLEMTMDTLNVILQELANTRMPGQKSSANDVIRAIQATSGKISDIVLWWRET